MTLQPNIPATVQERKALVRTYSRNAVLWGGGGLIVGLIVGITLSWWLCAIAIIAGATIAGINVVKANKVVNHKDDWS